MSGPEDRKVEKPKGTDQEDKSKNPPPEKVNPDLNAEPESEDD
jgi:hypothetical protein